jgi:hypothetical protein
VVGIFEHEGVYRGEIWGDVERMAAALERPVRQRVIAKIRPGTDLDALAETLQSDKRLPSKVQSEQAYFESQTSMLDGVLSILGNLLAGILGVAAVLGAANTMLAAVGAKAPYAATHIGISYMLQGEPDGSGVSNSDPYHPNPTEADDYVETGPHLMIIVPKAALSGLNDDPSAGGPYVMWKDTDYAHLMVPVD